MRNVSPRPRNVILIGGSQGSLSVIRTLLGGLPRELDAAVAVTVHRSPTFAFALDEHFSQHSTLPVVEPRHGQLFERRRVYVAPRDHHLVLRAGAVWLDRGAKQHHARPAIDVTFTSGAKAYGPRVIGVLLSGNLSDGVAGLVAIKQGGGLSLAQDPDEADAPSMPSSAIAFDDVDATFSGSALASLLTGLVAGQSVEHASAHPGVAALHHHAVSTRSAERG